MTCRTKPTPKESIEQPLPGSMSKEETLAQMIRVNHAGEYGARRIYQGQMAVLKDDECYETLKHMADQEAEHLAYFDNELIKRRIRPTALSPIWHVAGYALGAMTAKMSKEAAMACTVAVEEVIDEHYQEQLELLKESDDERDLSDTIEKFRQEELEHREIGLEHDAEQAPGYECLKQTIKLGSKVAIWLSKRI